LTVPPDTVSKVEIPNGGEVVEVRSAELDSVHMPGPIRIRTCTLPDQTLEGFGNTLSMAAVSVESGDLLFESPARETRSAASVVKLFTAAAALRLLGPDFRFRTSVVRGEEAGELFLVGGGDVTLTRSPGDNYYASKTSLQDLARQTRESLAGLVEDTYVIRPDTTHYDRFADRGDGWREGSFRLGYVAPVSALQVDADRDFPNTRLSGRSSDPTGRAVGWFVDELEQHGLVSVGLGAPEMAPNQGRELASVESAPLQDLLPIMLLDSDNSLAEVIAREVALADDSADIGASIQRWSGVDQSLFAEGSLVGGSGLDPASTLPHGAILGLLQQIATASDLELIRENLPESGVSGSLRTRFSGEASILNGRVRAKTGTLSKTRSLAGFVTAEDGSEIAFSINVAGSSVGSETLDDIDKLVGDISVCGENLTG
jgi:D-alanyl-D-alanine carboxypeptidase/D-alanyl-D-alanine-endopeptidase (penicillin-binding protein 4)